MKYILLLVCLSYISCTDQGWLGENYEYKILNTSPKNVTFKMYTDTSVLEGMIEVDSYYSFGIFNTEGIQPDCFKSDSVIIEFSDDMKLSYLSRDCFTKSIMCVTSFSCFNEANAYDGVCSFNIDSAEYIKAQ